MSFMKTSIFVAIALFSLSAAAEKIAVCDLGRAITSNDLAKKRFEELASESNLAKLKAESEGIVADATKLQKDFETNNLSWDEPRKARASREMEAYKADLQLLDRKLQAEHKAVNTQVLQEVQPIALEHLQSLIDEGKIDILISKEASLWNKGSVDITNKLIDRINKAKKK